MLFSQWFAAGMFCAPKGQSANITKRNLVKFLIFHGVTPVTTLLAVFAFLLWSSLCSSGAFG